VGKKNEWILQSGRLEDTSSETLKRLLHWPRGRAMEGLSEFGGVVADRAKLDAQLSAVLLNVARPVCGQVVPSSVERYMFL
jgi:hypothetical protein